VNVAFRPETPRNRDAALEVERLAFGSDEEPDVIRAVRDVEGSFALVGHVQFSRGWVGEMASSRSVEAACDGA
jgi:hypothetical protein